MVYSFTLRMLIIVFLLKRGLSLLNLARNGTATQSGDYRDPNGVTYGASRAIDGNTNQIWSGKSCGHTSLGRTTAWWKLDIGYIANIHRIVIYYREDQARRLDGFYLYILNSLNVTSGHQCFHDTQDGKLINTFQNITCNKVGRYVEFYNERKNPTSEALVELCEVEVFGCRFGKYGADCRSNCSDNCRDGYCDVQNGKCECKPGYKGARCTEKCENGSFGEDCWKRCHCLNHVKCDNVNGICPQGKCDKGWKTETCSEGCPQGSFGNDCINRCEGCVDEECDVENGKCLKGGCKPGHHGEICLVLGYSDHGGVSYAVYAGTIVGIIVVMAIAIIVWQSWSTRKKGKQKVYEDIHTNIDQENRPGNAEETYTELTTDEAYAEVHV